MKEAIAVFLFVVALALSTFWLVFRPLVAIGDIPGEIRKLRESVDNLAKIIKYKGEEK